MLHKRHIFESVPFAVAIVACSSSTVTAPADQPAAQTASDVTVATNYEASLVWAAADPVPTALFAATAEPSAEISPGASAATASAGAVNQEFSPSGCATATANANVATFTLNNCAGPGGLTGASGTFTATFAPSVQGLEIQLAGTNITANGANIGVASVGFLAVASDMVTKTFQANTASGGTGPFGNAVSRIGSYTLSWQSGTSCGTINGTFTDSSLDAGLDSGTGSVLYGGPDSGSDAGADGSLASTLDGGLDASPDSSVYVTANGGLDASPDSSVYVTANGGFDAGSDGGSEAGTDGGVATTSLNNFVSCSGQCPKSGTTTRTFNGGSVLITYNGSSNPPWAGSNGNTGTVGLHCQ